MSDLASWWRFSRYQRHVSALRPRVTNRKSQSALEAARGRELIGVGEHSAHPSSNSRGNRHGSPEDNERWNPSHPQARQTLRDHGLWLAARLHHFHNYNGCYEFKNSLNHSSNDSVNHWLITIDFRDSEHFILRPQAEETEGCGVEWDWCWIQIKSDNVVK